MVRDLFTRNASVLDFGCGSGRFLQEIGCGIGQGIGVDLDRRLIEGAARCNQFHHVQYLCADAKAGLPFDEERFNVIVAFGVLEHVGPEQPYIQEFHRLLRSDGRLVIDVPSNGPFRVFDIGNIKYNFPRLHRWFYHHVARQPEYYEEHFGHGAPMYGQFSREASEHKHYTASNLAAIAAPWFTMERQARYGLFFELIQFMEVLASKPFGRNRARFFSWLLEQDCRLVSPIGRANIVAVFRKQKCDREIS
jgi:SAM-dependent methyltransferase